MIDLFLIAHKVRGEPAFDIAMRCDDMGTPNDPGPWWIIPTSGHRAYPFWTKPWGYISGDKELFFHDGRDTYSLQLPEGLRDHYEISKPQTSAPARRAPRPLTPLDELA